MTEVPPRSIDDEGPALLGFPETPALNAYHHHLDHPFVNGEESDTLGRRIHDGNLAAQRLANPSAALEFEEYFALEHQVEKGRAARRVIASRHLQLVVGLANKFSFDQEQKAHMIGVGNVALVRCLTRYRHLDGRHITAFLQTSVATGLIAEVMALHRQQTGRSDKAQRTLREINRAYQAAQSLGEDVTYLEVAEHLGYRPERVQKILRLGRLQLRSINEPIQPGSQRNFGDTLSDQRATRAIEEVEDELLLKQVWDTATELHRRQILTEREWKIFVLRYRDGLTQEAIAQEWELPAQANISVIDRQVLCKIRREIEEPGCHEQALDPAYALIRTATDLLRILGVPIDTRTDIKATARFIVDNSGLTQLQQVTMHALLGTYERHFRPSEFAQLRGVAYRAVYDTREKAMRHLYATFADLPEMEDLTTQETIVARANNDQGTDEEAYDFAAALASIRLWSRGKVPLEEQRGPAAPGNNGQRAIRSADKADLLTQALELKPRGVLSKQDVGRLAAEGTFVDLETINKRFGSLKTFQLLCRQLRSQLRR